MHGMLLRNTANLRLSHMTFFMAGVKRDAMWSDCGITYTHVHRKQNSLKILPLHHLAEPFQKFEPCLEQVALRSSNIYHRLQNIVNVINLYFNNTYWRVGYVTLSPPNRDMICKRGVMRVRKREGLGNRPWDSD